MTKKDYVLFADMISGLYRNEETEQEPMTVEDFELQLLGVLKKENARFNLDKWNRYVYNKINK